MPGRNGNGFTRSCNDHISQQQLESYLWGQPLESAARCRAPQGEDLRMATTSYSTGKRSDFHGIIDNALPAVKTLELPSGGDK